MIASKGLRTATTLLRLASRSALKALTGKDNEGPDGAGFDAAFGALLASPSVAAQIASACLLKLEANENGWADSGIDVPVGA